MSQSALASTSDQTGSVSVTVAAQRDMGLQMRLFPTRAPEGEQDQVDLRVADDLAGMYYIG